MTDCVCPRGKTVLSRLFAILCVLMFSLTSALAAPGDKKDQSKDSSSDDDTFYHGTGINDLNAIGTRNVGCNRGLGNWYSLDTQVRMGQEFARQVEATS